MPQLTLCVCLLILSLSLAGCAEQAEQTEQTEQEESYADQMSEQHQGDTAAASGMASEPAMSVTGNTVRYGTVNGEQVTGYLAQPQNPDSVASQRGLASADALPAIVVVHEWWGLNDNIRAMARQLAGEGFRALAVDLYGGQAAEAPQQARQLMQTAMGDEDALMTNMRAANQYLQNQEQAPRVGIIGWCFGGSVTMNTVLAMPDLLDAAVIYYGQPATDRQQLAELDLPILAFFGAEDGSIPMSKVDSFRQALQAVSDASAVHVYEDAGHAFANPSGERYVPDAAQDAWQKTTRFLHQQLFETGS